MDEEGTCSDGQMSNFLLYLREEKPGPCFVWIQRCYGQAPWDDLVVHRPVSAPTPTQSYNRFLEGSTLPGVNILVARSWESLGGSGWEGKGLVESKEILREGLGLPGCWQEGIYRICSGNNLISNRKGFNILVTRMTVYTCGSAAECQLTLERTKNNIHTPIYIYNRLKVWPSPICLTWENKPSKICDTCNK